MRCATNSSGRPKVLPLQRQLVVLIRVARLVVLRRSDDPAVCASYSVHQPAEFLLPSKAWWCPASRAADVVCLSSSNEGSRAAAVQQRVASKNVQWRVDPKRRTFLFEKLKRSHLFWSVCVSLWRTSSACTIRDMNRRSERISLSTLWHGAMRASHTPSCFWLAGDAVPVSYTHLDVYKRQQWRKRQGQSVRMRGLYGEFVYE